MKQLLALLLALSLTAQAMPQTPPASAPQKKSGGTTPAREARHIAIEDMLPANTLFFGVTTNLSGLVENFRRLGIYRILESRLPKNEQESDENPLKLAAEFLSGGIEDASVLDDARIGFAVIQPALPSPGQDAQALSRMRAGAENPPDANRNEAKAPGPTGSEFGGLENGHYALFVETASAEQARKAKERFIPFFSETFTDLGKPDEAKPVSLPAFKGFEVERYQGGYLGMMIGTTFVLGDQKAMEALIAVQTADRHTNDIGRLADDLDYAQSRGQTVLPAGLFAYVSGRVLTEYSTPAVAGILPGGFSDMVSKLMEPGSIRALTMTSTFERDGVVDRFTLVVDDAKKNLLSTIFSGPALDFRTTRYVPKGTPILFNHSVDFVRLYDDLIVPAITSVLTTMEAFSRVEKEMTEWREKKGKNDSPRQPDEEEGRAREEALKRAYAEVGRPEYIQSVIARYERQSGVKFRDELARSLGNELTVAASIPPPAGRNEDKQTHFAVFLQLKEKEVARQAISKLIAWGMGTLGGGVFGGGNKNSEGEADAAPPKEKTDEELKQEIEQRLALINMLPREKYKNAEIVKMMALDIAWTDDYLVVADSAETIKRMMDLADSGEALDRDPAFARAMSGAGGSMTTRLYVGPDLIEGMLSGFLKSWTGRETGDLSGAHNLPATVAAFASAENNKLQAEVYSPMGLPGMLVFSEFSSSVETRARTSEFEARRVLRTMAAVQKRYAAKHQQRFGALTDLVAFQKNNPPPPRDDTPPPSGVKLRGAARETPSEDDDARRFNEDLSALTKAKFYRYDLKLRTDKRGYEATATPARYGRNGRRSFFMDQTGKMRSADKKGEPASARDEEDEDNN